VISLIYYNGAMMEKMKWDNSYNLGIPSIDNEHKRLLVMINKLAAFPEIEYSSETFSEVVMEAINYAITHFKSEETFMETIHYPRLEAHKNEHKLFLLKMAEESKLAMEKNEGISDLLEYLYEWFIHHILYSDMEIVKFQPNPSFIRPDHQRIFNENILEAH
jgi:hemerythrin-like metal-binding protein